MWITPRNKRQSARSKSARTSGWTAGKSEWISPIIRTDRTEAAAAVASVAAIISEVEIAAATSEEAIEAASEVETEAAVASVEAEVAAAVAAEEGVACPKAPTRRLLALTRCSELLLLYIF